MLLKIGLLDIAIVAAAFMLTDMIIIALFQSWARNRLED